MATIYWASLLHFYQPPIQLPEVLRKVVDESYRPLIDVFKQNPHARVSVNINGVLTEMLYESGYQDVIDGLRELAEGGQVEFVGSAKFHAILPLIDESEQRRQIRRNHLTNRHFFGEVYQPRGFFPPEMGYDRSILEPILDLGHEWVIMSGVACPAAWPTTSIYETKSDDGNAIAVIFRDDVLSNKISFQDMDGKAFVSHLRATYGNDRDMYIVTAMDAETFGHHIENWDQLFLADAYEAVAPYAGVVQPRSLAASTRTLLTLTERDDVPDPVVATTISGLFDRFPRGEDVDPRPASWSTTHADLDAGVPYPLWQAPGNYIHKLQWEHVDVMSRLVATAQDAADTPISRRHAEIARGLMDPALHSCQFWWASRRPHWDVNMIARGLAQQEGVIVNAFRAINLSDAAEETKREAYYRVVASRDIRDKIHDQLFWD
jgi:hypothetical protein